MKEITRNKTREINIGSIFIGNNHPIAVQSMASEHTWQVPQVLSQLKLFEEAGADIVRIAVDSDRDVKALPHIRDKTQLNLTADLQENYRVVAQIAPFVDKIRYNPGHLYHLDREKPWQEKVKHIVDTAVRYSCALRVGVNAGSIDPSLKEKYTSSDLLSPMIESALMHCELLDTVGFKNYCVSLKHSDPLKVVYLNTQFAARRPEIPLHLGVTEAGLPPEGIIKTRIALEQLVSKGIGDTIRVSLTLSNNQKAFEVAQGREILQDIYQGKVRSVVHYQQQGLNLISCPSCSRVENTDYVSLAHQIRDLTQYAQSYNITIAVMGCRVNGPGETDEADLGVWCGPHHVNLKKGKIALGSFAYDKILPQLKKELDVLIEGREHQNEL